MEEIYEGIIYASILVIPTAMVGLSIRNLVRTIQENRRLNFVQEYVEVSKNELSDEGRERLKKRGLDYQFTEEVKL